MIERIITEAAYRIKFDIEKQIVKNGLGFEEARKIALKNYVFAGLEARNKKHITDLIYDMPMSDLQERAKTSISTRVYYEALKVNARKDTWLRRFVWGKIGRLI